MQNINIFIGNLYARVAFNKLLEIYSYNKIIRNIIFANISNENNSFGSYYSQSFLFSERLLNKLALNL